MIECIYEFLAFSQISLYIGGRSPVASERAACEHHDERAIGRANERKQPRGESEQLSGEGAVEPAIDLLG